MHLSPDIADNVVCVSELDQALQQVRAHLFAILLESLLLDDIQNGNANRTCQRIAAKRIEMARLQQTFSDLWRCDDGTHWKAVADPLGHRHHVGHNVMRLKAPEMVAGTAESTLNLCGRHHIALVSFAQLAATNPCTHLVRYENAAVLANHAGGPFQIALGQLHRTADALYALGNHASTTALRNGVLEFVLQIFDVSLGSLALVARTIAIAYRLHR